MVKAKYKLKNWSVYNKSLVNRGSINLWFSNNLEQGWFYKTKKDGDKSVKIYSDKVIVNDLQPTKLCNKFIF